MLREHAAQVKLEFITECDAESAAGYFDERGIHVKLMGKAPIAINPDSSDLALVMTSHQAYTVDIADGDIPDKD